MPVMPVVDAGAGGPPDGADAVPGGPSEVVEAVVAGPSDPVVAGPSDPVACPLPPGLPPPPGWSSSGVVSSWDRSKSAGSGIFASRGLTFIPSGFCHRKRRPPPLSASVIPEVNAPARPELPPNSTSCTTVVTSPVTPPVASLPTSELANFGTTLPATRGSAPPIAPPIAPALTIPRVFCTFHRVRSPSIIWNVCTATSMPTINPTPATMDISSRRRIIRTAARPAATIAGTTCGAYRANCAISNAIQASCTRIMYLAYCSSTAVTRASRAS